jgi:CheY-like chemotaxis protein
MDGEHTATIIRHTPGISTIPIIVLTSVGRRGEVSHLRDLGCDGYLLKPVRQSSLQDTIAAVMSDPDRDGNVRGRAVVTRHTIREKKLRNVKILLVEDNPINRKVALAVLKREGYRADTAENGFLAVEMAGRKKYDLILMDVQMPGMDGVEATRLIREKEDGGRRAVIIAMTAHDQSDDKERCLAAGMDDYITKPLELSEVFGVLGRRLRGKADGGPLPRKEEAPAGEASDHGGSPADAIIDMESAMTRFGGDREFYHELIGDFLSYVPGKITALEEALRMRDIENVQGYAHSIKGAAGNLSARKVFSTALRIESKAGDGVLTDVPQLIEELKSEVARLRELKLSA